MIKITRTLLCATMMVSAVSAAQRLQDLRGGGQPGGDAPNTPIRSQFEPQRRDARLLGLDSPAIVQQVTSRINADEDVPEGLKPFHIIAEVRKEKKKRNDLRHQTIEAVNEQEAAARIIRVQQEALAERLLAEAEDQRLIREAEEERARAAQAIESNQELLARIVNLETQIQDTEERARLLQVSQSEHEANVQRLENLMTRAQQFTEAELARMENELAEETRKRDEALRDLRVAQEETARLREQERTARESQIRLRQQFNGRELQPGQGGGNVPMIPVPLLGGPNAGGLPVNVPVPVVIAQPNAGGAGDQAADVVVVNNPQQQVQGPVGRPARVNLDGDSGDDD
jgi:hypothetical protein